MVGDTFYSNFKKFWIGVKIKKGQRQSERWKRTLRKSSFPFTNEIYHTEYQTVILL